MTKSKLWTPPNITLDHFYNFGFFNQQNQSILDVLHFQLGATPSTLSLPTIEGVSNFILTLAKDQAGNRPKQVGGAILKCNSSRALHRIRSLTDGDQFRTPNQTSLDTLYSSSTPPRMTFQQLTLKALLCMWDRPSHRQWRLWRTNSGEKQKQKENKQDSRSQTFGLRALPSDGYQCWSYHPWTISISDPTKRLKLRGDSA